MKKFFAVIFAGIILLTTANVLSANYVGNSNSKKFHYSDCASAAKIKPANKIIFSSRDEAVASGYVQCKICQP